MASPQSSGGYADDAALAHQLQVEETLEVEQPSSDEESETQNLLTDLMEASSPEEFQQILGGITNDDDLQYILDQIEDQKARLSDIASFIKTKLKENYTARKEERDAQKKARDKAATALRVEQTQQGNIDTVIRFEGNDYNITVKGIFTLKDLRLRLMMLFPDVFINESMVASLVYELNGVVMNNHARRTMKADKQGQGWNLTNNAIINVRRQTADEVAQAKAKAKAKGKSKAAPKPKSTPSSGSGAQ